MREVFEEFGREDPLYAALARSGYRNNRWDPEAFFETGRNEIGEVMAYVEALGLELRRQRTLDFGCGAGRLTQALADHFQEAVGVDIASAMVERAREYDRKGGNVRYLVNAAPDLGLFQSGSFDLVYSNKVLQHVPPEHQLRYVKEFVRVLRPGGLAIFQMRNGPPIRSGSLRAFFYTVNRRYLRRLFQRIRGRKPYEMHYVARTRVEEAVDEAGGRMIDVLDLDPDRPRKSLRYCVERVDS